MKHFLENLLIVFALSLCGLIAFQWVRETGLRKEVQRLTDVTHEKSEAIQTLEASLKRNEAEIHRLDALKNDLNNTVKSNQLQISNLSKDLEKTQNELERDKRQIATYKEALDTANENILRQNEDIKKQNEEMKKLAEDRNEIVQRHNKLATEFKELADRWNKQQEDLAKASTNAPAKKP
jgi:chromosome segregation ATPase